MEWEEPEEITSDREYYLARQEGYAYVSKSFRGPMRGSHLKRFVIFKVSTDDDMSVESALRGQIVIRSSPQGSIQLKALVIEDSHQIDNIVIQSFRRGKPMPDYVSFRRDEFVTLLKFLEAIQFIEPGTNEKIRIRIDEIDTAKRLVEASDLALIEQLKSIDLEKRSQIFENLSGDITAEDLNILSGRRRGLEVFRSQLFDNQDWLEPDWQRYFQNNTWIFGYGLEYRFLSILQREANVSDVHLDGSDVVKGDFLMGTNEFTVLVEVKRPDTDLFAASKYRSRSWELSQHLTNAVSQILTQKAEWEVKSAITRDLFIGGKKMSQRTFDPKVILLVGSSQQYSGDDEDSVLKARTFELYRRNSRSVEILTYSELFERAYFIVNQEPFTPPPSSISIHP